MVNSTRGISSFLTYEALLIEKVGTCMLHVKAIWVQEPKLSYCVK